MTDEDAFVNRELLARAKVAKETMTDIETLVAAIMMAKHLKTKLSEPLPIDIAFNVLKVLELIATSHVVAYAKLEETQRELFNARLEVVGKTVVPTTGGT